MQSVKFDGCWTALVTPFLEGGIDVKALRRHVEAQIQGQVSGLVPCGTTGETPTLSEAEWAQVISITLDTNAGRLPVMAGCGSNSTAHTIYLAKRAEELGVDALLVVVPYYNKPSQPGLFAHFKAVAEAVSIPVCVYNIPGRSAVGLTRETMAKLAEIPNIQAVKEATGDMFLATEFFKAAGKDLRFFSGDDFTLLPFLALGGHGGISVLSNIAPRRTSLLIRAARAGDMVTARDLHFRLLPLMEALFLEGNPGPVKAALALMGRMEPTLRLPLVYPEPSTIARLSRELKKLGLSVIEDTDPA